MAAFFAGLFYLASAVLVAGLAVRIRQYAGTPAPLKIPTTPAPTTRGGVALRLLREVVLFESHLEPQGARYVALDPFVGTGTTTLAAAALGRSSTGVDTDPAMIGCATTALEGAVERLNTWTAARLERHHAFVRERVAAGRRLAYRNTPHGFPVVTRQERDLELELVDAIRAEAPGLYTVTYRPA